MATIVIVLAVVLFFGAMFLMLALGYQDTEQKREREAQSRQVGALQQAAAVGTVLGFFGPAQAPQAPVRIAFNDSLVSLLERDIQLEQAIVAQFVHHPSLDTLYQHPVAPNLVQ